MVDERHDAVAAPSGAAEFRKFPVTLDKQVPPEVDVHVICDNYGAHNAPAVAK